MLWVMERDATVKTCDMLSALERDGIKYGAKNGSYYIIHNENRKGVKE